MRTKAWGWLGAGAAAAALVVVSALALVHPSVQPAPALLGRPAPELTIQSLDGRQVSLLELRGRPLVVNFWASWCAGCRQELSVLNQAAAGNAGRVGFVGVDIQDSPDAAQVFESRNRHLYPVGPATSGSYLRFGVTAPPETFFIEPGGVIVGHVVGPVAEKVMRDHLERASR